MTDSNGDLGLEYGVVFNTEKSGEDATTRIMALNDKWEQFMLDNPIHVKFDTSAYQNPDNKNNGSDKEKEKKEKLSALERDQKKIDALEENAVARHTNTMSGYADGYNEVRVALAELNKQNAIRIQADNAEEQSIIGMEKTLAALRQEYRLLKTEKERKSASGQEQLAEITALDARVKELNKTMRATAELKKEAAKQLVLPNTKDTFSMKELDVTQVEVKLKSIQDLVAQLAIKTQSVGFDNEKLNGVIKKTTSEFDRLTQKLAGLKAGFGNQGLDKLLTINPKSIQEANALMAELAKRREALNRNDSGYVNSITNINKKQAELSAQNAKDLSLGIEKTKQIHNETSAYEKQSNVISNLRNIAATYLSIYEAGRLIKNIATITGEFELQQKSLAAILRDADAANKIFGQVKSLAVVSPFQFKDLLSYTKQLAAYRIETDTLYDTMKNLADVSAGLGVDMSRIILAYGQVSAASVLRGQELRQFTEAGIPLVALLADKFTELEGRVVSTGEVFGKISERLVPFQMVKDVFADMSSEGGMFFNMQEIQAATLAGKISNLTDAYQIMFASMGESDTMNGALKGGVDMLMNMAKNWEDIATVILPVVGAIGVYKAGVLMAMAGQKAQNMISGEYAVIAKANAIAAEQETAAIAKKAAVTEINLVIGRADLAAQQGRALFGSSIVQSLKGETAALAIRNIMLKTSNTEVGRNIAVEQISQVLTKRGIAVDIAKAQATAIVAASMKLTGDEALSMSAKMKAAFLTNPAGWFLAAIAALGMIIFWISAAVKKSNALRDELSKIGSDGALESSRLVNKFERLATVIVKATNGSNEQVSALKSLKQIYGEILPVQLLTVEGLKELGGNYESVTKAITAYIAAKEKEKAQEAIDKNIDDTLSPKVTDAKSGLVKMGIDTKDADMAMKKFLSDVEVYGLRGLTPLQKMNEVLKSLGLQKVDDSMKVYSRSGMATGLYEDKDASRLNGILMGVSAAYKDVRAEAEKLKPSTKDALYAFTNEFAKFKDGVLAVQEKMSQGDDTDWMFGEKKSKLAQQNYRKFLTYIENETKKTTIGGVTTYTYKGNKMEEVNYLKSIETIQNAINSLDADKFTKTVNGIIQKASDSIPNGKKLFSNMFFSGDEYQLSLDNMKTDYERNLKDIEALKDGAKRGGASDKTLGGQSIDDLTKQAAVQKKVLDYYNQLSDKEKKAASNTVGSTVNPRIATLESELALVEQAKKKYEELNKAGMSPDDSKAKVEELFKGQFKLIGADDKVLFEPVFDEKGLIVSYKVAKGELQKMLKTEKAVFGVTMKMNEAEVRIFTDELKAKLKSIQDEFDTSKKRVDIFKNIFDATSDFDLAGKIAASFEGNGTTDIETAIKTALKQAFDSTGVIKISDFIDDKGNVDFAGASAAIDAQLKVKNQEESIVLLSAKKQLDIAKDFKQKEIVELLKGLSDFDAYEIKRTAILRSGEVERQKIRESNLFTPDEKAIAITASNSKQSKADSKLTADQFKGSDLWQKVFGDLDKVSDASINLLKDRVQKYIDTAGKDFDPTQAREMMKTLDDLKDRVAKIDLGAVFKAVFTKIDLTPLKAKMDEAMGEMDRLKLEQESDVRIQNTAKIEVAKYDGDNSIKNGGKKLIVQANLEASTNRLTETNKKLATSERQVENATKNYTDAADNKKKVLTDNIKAAEKEIASMNAMKNAVSGVIDAFYAVSDAMGITIDPETKVIIDGIVKGLTAVIAVMTAIVAVEMAINIGLTPILAVIWPILLAFAALVAVFAIIKGTKLNGINDQLKKQEKIVEGLTERYADLERQMSDALGSDWIKMYNEQLANTASQIAGISKQIELEKSKGKDADPEDLKKFEEDLKAQRIIAEEQAKKLQQFVTGTDLTSAAKDFATAWLDAYKSFGSTTEAMSAKFKDLMSNMVVNMLLAKGFEALLKPVMDEIELQAKTGKITKEGWDKIWGKGGEFMANADAYGKGVAGNFDLSKLGEAANNLAGVSKGISGITEDTALLLGGYLDSFRQRLFAYFDLKALEKPYDFSTGMAGLLAGQSVQITHLVAISANTLRTASACEALTSEIQSVKAPSTSGSGFAIRVNA